jgi:hypothetical protein
MYMVVHQSARMRHDVPFDVDTQSRVCDYRTLNCARTHAQLQQMMKILRLQPQTKGLGHVAVAKLQNF